MRRRRFLAIAGAMLARPARAEVVRWQVPAFGGTVSIDLRGRRGMAEAVRAEVTAVIAEVEGAASLFRAGSALSRLNAAGRLDDPPPALIELLALSDLLHRATDGAFDPTVQPLWRALAEGRDPGPTRALIGWGRVMRAPLRLSPGQALTLNGIAQGYAADRVRAVLIRAGYEMALVDMGEFAAIGGPFTLGIADPDLGLCATRRLTGTAIATSSPGALRLGGQGHILGPGGQPALWSTVAVEAESAAIADGLSTAFCLMPEAAIRAALARLPGRVTLVSPSGDLSTIGAPAG